MLALALNKYFIGRILAYGLNHKHRPLLLSIHGSSILQIFTSEHFHNALSLPDEFIQLHSAFVFIAKNKDDPSLSRTLWDSLWIKLDLTSLELLHKPGDIFIFSSAGLMTFPNSFSDCTQAGL